MAKRAVILLDLDQIRRDDRARRPRLRGSGHVGGRLWRLRLHVRGEGKDRQADQSSGPHLQVAWRFDTLAREVDRLSEGFDALIAPTCAITAPKIADVQDPKAFGRANSLLLRNARIVNLLDRCAISLPMHAAETLPTGLMLTGETLGDARLLSVAEAVETALAPEPVAA